MTSNRFLVKPENLRLPYARLEGEEHHHLSRVLRVRPGERVWLVEEGEGAFRAEVLEIGPNETRLRVLEGERVGTTEMPVILAQSLIKPKNMDLVIQKATELGVREIVPVEASRSVSRIGGRGAPKLARWQRIAREAAKQSRRTDIPSVSPPQPFSDFLGSRKEPRKFILCEAGGTLMRDLLTGPPVETAPAGDRGVVLLVGPEGGWSGEEESRAFDHGFQAASLGTRILRSETAALAGLAVIQALWGD